MKIIAISGKKQSGKTTAIKDLQNKIDVYEVLNFADCLKELVFSYFAAPTEEYEHTVHEPFTTEESKQLKHPCGKTYRELLQIIGTDMFRGLWPDIWIENYKFRAGILCTDYPQEVTILTADVRFPNEIECIQDLGGHVIRLLRNPFNDQHESETALDNYSLRDGGEVVWNKVYNEGLQRMRSKPGFDAIVDNRNMDIPAQNKAVIELIKERKWL